MQHNHLCQYRMVAPYTTRIDARSSMCRCCAGWMVAFELIDQIRLSDGQAATQRAHHIDILHSYMTPVLGCPKSINLCENAPSRPITTTIIVIRKYNYNNLDCY